MILEINDNNNKNINFSNFSSELTNYLEKTEATFSVDRFEENFAVCENIKTGEITNIPIEVLPDNIEEGSILKFKNGIYVIDIEATKMRKQEIKTLVNNLFKRKN